MKEVNLVISQTKRAEITLICILNGKLQELLQQKVHSPLEFVRYNRSELDSLFLMPKSEQEAQRGKGARENRVRWVGWRLMDFMLALFFIPQNISPEIQRAWGELYNLLSLQSEPDTILELIGWTERQKWDAFINKGFK